MGRYKDMQTEYESGPISTFSEDKHVCTQHFDDEYINDYIRENGEKGTCSYCGKSCAKVLDMRTFMEYVSKRLLERLCPIEDADLPLASSFYDDENEEIPGFSRKEPYIMPDNAESYDDVKDLMTKYGLYTDCDKLNEDIASCFNCDNWTQKDVFAEDLNETLSYAWESFSDMVKYKKRYTFFNDPHFVRQENWNDDVLTQINLLCGAILKSTLPKDTVIYRGRPNGSFNSFQDLTAPPSAYAKENRMSPAGISMFYGSLDKDTPVQEIRNYAPNAKITMGEFKLTKDLVVIDLSKIPAHLSFWMPKHFREYKFLTKFHSEITQPLGQNPGYEYVPTQIFTEYIRYMNNYHIDGIIYQSALTHKKNVVLFYDHETSTEVLQLHKTYIVN